MPNVKPLAKAVIKGIDFMTAFKPLSKKQIQTKLESLFPRFAKFAQKTS